MPTAHRRTLSGGARKRKSGALVGETGVKPDYTKYLYYLKGKSLYKCHKRTKAKTSAKANVMQKRESGYMYFTRPDGPRGTLNVYRTKMAKRFSGGKRKSSGGKRRSAPRKLSKCTKGRVRRRSSPRRCIKRSTLAKEAARKRRR